MSVEEVLEDPTLQEALALVGKLRESCAQLRECQKPDQSEQAAKLSDVRRQIMTGLVELRMLNKKAQDVVRQTKEETVKYRQDLDSTQLDIQNVLYQNKHLRTEIERCNEYESKLSTIEMVPEDEFFNENPQTNGLSEHEMTLERLKDEEKRRLELFFTKTKLQETRKVLQEDIDSLKADIEDKETFNKQMDRIVQGAEPLRKTLEKY